MYKGMFVKAAIMHGFCAGFKACITTTAPAMLRADPAVLMSFLNPSLVTVTIVLVNTSSVVYSTQHLLSFFLL